MPYAGAGGDWNGLALRRVRAPFQPVFARLPGRVGAGLPVRRLLALSRREMLQERCVPEDSDHPHGFQTIQAPGQPCATICPAGIATQGAPFLSGFCQVSMQA